MVFKEFNNSLYIKRNGHLFFKNLILYHGTKKKFQMVIAVQNPGLGASNKYQKFFNSS